jgi:colanic acid/amylovoran biosynthesis glycosyltransferase
MISVARLTEKKGLHVGIEACRLLKERGVAFTWTILGIGPWEGRLRTLIEQYQLDDVIHMPGFKPSHEVKAMLDEADLFYCRRSPVWMAIWKGFPWRSWRRWP